MKIRLKNTKLVDEYKRPISFFHTSPVGEIERFLPLSHFGTKKAAQMRSRHFIYQLLGVSEPAVLPDELPQSITEKLSKLKNAPELFTYNVFLYSKSSLKIPDLGKHSLEQYYNWFSTSYKPKPKFLSGKERLEGDGVGETKTAYKKALTEFIFIDPFSQTKENLEKELMADSLYPLSDLNTQPSNIPSFLRKSKENFSETPFNLAEKAAFGRLIRFLEKEGYDTFSYKNSYEDKNQTSYIIFRPEQVFMPTEAEHTLPDKNLAFLTQQEKQFFSKKGMLSPSERTIPAFHFKRQQIR